MVCTPNLAYMINSPWPTSGTNLKEIGGDLRNGDKLYIREMPLFSKMNFCFRNFNEKIVIFDGFKASMRQTTLFHTFLPVTQ